MEWQKQLRRLRSGGAFLAVLTLCLGGLFKIAAFAREVFIASHFGLSNVTDAYFAFQQFPLTLATFMFGAFGLAFTPVYAAEKRDAGRVAWLPGLVVYGGLLGVAFTLLMKVGEPWLLRGLGNGSVATGGSTVLLLSFSFTPVIWLGIWSGVMIASGKNLLSMFVAGLPYLFMTILLLCLYGLGWLDNLSLPVSFLAGFGLIGCAVFVWLVSRECDWKDVGAVMRPWLKPGFRRFLGQLSASSVENLGYSANQLLLVYSIAQAGTGAVSANTCAFRVGMIGFTLLGQPLAQLVQAKFCAADDRTRPELFRRWLGAIATVVLLFALLLLLGREPLTRLVYLHGKFSAVELAKVLAIVPAWVAYYVVASLNGIVARYLFASGQGSGYVRRQLCAYAGANVIRISLWGQLSAPAMIWCTVLAEGCALVMSLRSCRRSLPLAVPVLEEALAGVHEV